MKHASTLLHIGLIILALMLLSSSSFAESELPSEVTVLFQNAFPTHTMLLSDQYGFTAAAVKTIRCYHDEPDILRCQALS